MKANISDVTSALKISILEPGAAKKKATLVGILERVCQNLELSKSQYEEAERKYIAVGDWLGHSSHVFLQDSTIYAQGSIGLGTTVKPLDRDEFDIDLVCFCTSVPETTLPQALKAAVGDRLREDDTYLEILEEEKPRCWRLSYANEFHMDITPSIIDPRNTMGGELVPDKNLGAWKESNPKGYKAWFEKREALLPLMLPLDESARLKAEVEALPEHGKFAGLLRRCVQLLKRHRDVHYHDSRQKELAPISIILTTLATKSYEHSVSSKMYDNELDLLVDVIARMPSFIEKEWAPGQYFYFVWNETTNRENFAEKWNNDPRLPSEFYAWHKQALKDFSGLAELIGMDTVQKELENKLGAKSVGRAFSTITREINKGRSTGKTGLIAGVGVTVGSSDASSIRKNTFYGSAPKRQK